MLGAEHRKRLHVHEAATAAGARVVVLERTLGLLARYRGTVALTEIALLRQAIEHCFINVQQRCVISAYNALRPSSTTIMCPCRTYQHKPTFALTIISN